MKTKFLTCLLIVQSVLLTAQSFELTHNCKQAYESIIALEFEKGRNYLQIEHNENPQNLLPVLYQSYIDFLQVILGENADNYEAFKDKKKSRLRKIKSGNDDSPFYHYALANIYLHHAFSRVRFKEYFKAMFEIKRAYRLLTKNVKEYPEFIPNYIGMGLLHSMIGSIPENYKWVSWLANMKGTVEQGIGELYKVLYEAEKGGENAYLLTEASFYLTFIEINLNANQDQPEKLLQILNSRPFDTPLTLYAKVSVYMRSGRNDKALELLEQFKQTESSFQFHYLKYLQGMAYLNKLDQKCIEYFSQYLRDFKGGTYVKSAYQKIAWMHLLNGNIEGYKDQMKKCIALGNKNLDGDKQAQKEAENNIVPNVYLLKARLLFDGGYYQESLNILNENRFKISVDDRVLMTELLYRFGRNYQNLKQYKMAKHYFKRAIGIGSGLKEYFAGNSCLQLGTIYEIERKADSANYYYKKCLDLDFETYKTSLDFKAKAKMKKLETKKGAE